MGYQYYDIGKYVSDLDWWAKKLGFCDNEPLLWSWFTIKLRLVSGWLSMIDTSPNYIYESQTVRCICALSERGEVEENISVWRD